MKYLKVEILGNPRPYTYAWDSSEVLERGDFVVLPPNSYNPRPAIGRVLRLMDRCDFSGTVTVLSQKASTTPVQREVDQRVDDDIL